MDTQKNGSTCTLKMASQKVRAERRDATTLRREEYHKLGYVVTCGE